MKLGHHKGMKVTEPDFWKKSLGSQVGEEPHFWGIFDIFVYISASSHQDFLKFHIHNAPVKLSNSGFIIGTRPLFLRLDHFCSIFVVLHIMSVVMQLSEQLEILKRCTLFIVIWRPKMIFSEKLYKEGLCR